MFETTTFFSIWYWVLTAVFWSMASHFTHGVPYDALSRAARFGAEDARIFDALARRSLVRIDLGLRRFGIAASAATGFLLAVIGVLGFWVRMEWAQGLFALFAPAVWMMALSFREARHLNRAQPSTEALLRGFLIRRRINQSIGLTAVFLTVAAFSWKHQDRIFLFTVF